MSRSVYCTAPLQNVFSYYRMCSLTIQCVLLLQNVFSYHVVVIMSRSVYCTAIMPSPYYTCPHLSTPGEATPSSHYTRGMYMNVTIHCTSTALTWAHQERRRIYNSTLEECIGMKQYIRNVTIHYTQLPSPEHNRRGTIANARGHIWDIRGHIWDIRGHIWDLSTTGEAPSPTPGLSYYRMSSLTIVL